MIYILILCFCNSLRAKLIFKNNDDSKIELISNKKINNIDNGGAFGNGCAHINKNSLITFSTKLKENMNGE